VFGRVGFGRDVAAAQSYVVGQADAGPLEYLISSWTLAGADQEVVSGAGCDGRTV
jgi:hypothetical protein